MSVQELEAEVMKLPSSERARLAERILATLDADADIEAAWSEEAARRLEEIETGAVQTIPAADVFAEARTRLRR
ncbi:MAG TPA: addiction module protein [Rhodothermales bacterium]|nr:addiction module protein [Rhodothermales bacterium]